VPDPSPDSLLLARDLRAAVSDLRRLVRDAGPEEGLSRSQEATLAHLGRRPGLSTADLARLEHVRPQSMGQTVQVLERAGFVRREADPADARRELILRTDAGRDAMSAVAARRESDLAGILTESFDEDALRRIRTAVDLLAATVPADTARRA
jgi:DNA-binding MarR family transcriptional regulator